MSELKEIREKVLMNIKEVVRQNKSEIEDAYKRVMKLEYVARREGLIALEYEAEFMSREIHLCNQIIEMIELVVDGTEPKVFEELITLKFFAVHNYTEIDALLYFLYARSMLMIQAGVSSWLIEEFFNSIIPKEVTTFRKKRIMFEESKKNKINEWKSAFSFNEKELLINISKQLKGLTEEEWKYIVSSRGFYGFNKILPYLDEDVKALAKNYMNDYRYYVIMRSPSIVLEQELNELSKELEEVISILRNKTVTKNVLDNVLKCNNEEIQLLLKNVDNFTLSVALKGVKEEVAECFYRNLSLSLKYIVQEDLEYMGAIRMCEIKDAQKKIFHVAKDLLGWSEEA